MTLLSRYCKETSSCMQWCKVANTILGAKMNLNDMLLNRNQDTQNSALLGLFLAVICPFLACFLQMHRKFWSPSVYRPVRKI